MDWTRENVDRLRRMIEVEHKSYREAAIALGTTRSAVAGKATRLAVTNETRSVSPWTDESIERLRALAENGATISEASRALGIKRHTIKRKGGQLGLTFRVGEFRSPDQAKRKAPRSRAERIVYLREKMLEIEPRLPLDEMPLTAISLFDLDDFTCRWPYGERSYKFCGRREANLGAGHPYCPMHEVQSFERVLICEAAE